MAFAGLLNPEVSVGLATATYSWNDSTRQKPLLLDSNQVYLTLGARFTFAIKLSERFDLDLAPSVEWHNSRASSLARTFYPSASTNLFCFDAGPTLRLKLLDGLVQPIIGIEAGYGVYVIDGIENPRGGSGFALSAVGGVVFGFSRSFSGGIALRYRVVWLRESGSEVGVARTFSDVVSLRLSF